MKLKRIAVVGSLAVAFVGIGTTAASADSGDGQLACNKYEICFSRDYPASVYQKHFYYAGSHSGYVWTNVSTGVGTNQPMQNTASSVANRDGSCDVKVVNDRGILPDSTITIGNSPNSLSFKYLGSINDANDRHERFNC